MSEMDEKVEEPQEQAAERPPIHPELLRKILEAHRKWVESEGKEGERADLFEANLQGANLSGANLQGADLRGYSSVFVTRTSGLTTSQVKAALNWELAFYSADFLKKLGLPPDHNERVKKKLAELEKGEKGTGEK